MWHWQAAQQPQTRQALGNAAHGKRTRRAALSLALATVLAGCAAPTVPPQPAGALPPGFVHLHAVVPDALQDMRYHGSHNFLGRPVAGYGSPTCILTERAARALRAAQEQLRLRGLTIKVFDCYRPQTAVNDFVRWGADLADQATKAAYYPSVPKAELFQRGYIAEKSGHSRGSTVDLTLVVVDGLRAAKVLRGPLADGQEVDMGSPFDMFDVRSHTENADLSPDVQHNRRWLRALLAQQGFRNLPEEWWHYTLADEPFPDRYFDFAVTAP